MSFLIVTFALIIANSDSQLSEFPPSSQVIPWSLVFGRTVMFPRHPLGLESNVTKVTSVLTQDS